MCGCEFDIKNQSPLNIFSDEDIENAINAAFRGGISTRHLPVDIYVKIARKLFDGVVNGYGLTLEQTVLFDDDYFMLKALRENVYVFSGAKTYQQIREVSSLLSRTTGFNEFKKSARDILELYNETYLRAEYNSAIAQGRTASQWQEIQRDKAALPMLTYHTVGDAVVRPTHRELDQITRPVDDKFWDVHMPPNGWNCRCDVLQSDDEVKTDLRGFKTPEDVPEIFRFNAGKERIIFSEKHPYFKIAPQDKDFARINFGLPLP